MNSVMREALCAAGADEVTFPPAPKLEVVHQGKEGKLITIEELVQCEKDIARYFGFLAETAYKGGNRERVECLRMIASLQESRLGDRIRFSLLIAEIDTLSSFEGADEVTYRLTHEPALRFRREIWPRYCAVGNSEAKARLRDTRRNLLGYFTWRDRHYFPTNITPEPKGQVLIKNRIVPAIARVTASMGA